MTAAVPPFRRSVAPSESSAPSSAERTSPSFAAARAATAPCTSSTWRTSPPVSPDSLSPRRTTPSPSTKTADEARRLGMTIWQITGRGGLSRELGRVTDLRMRLRLPRPPAEVLAARARRLPTRGPALGPASIVPHDGTPSRMS